ncbi:hypothetical protein [Phycicoccus sp. Soil802]|uniref:hypothetical protein n=1 Tax=Phycicoccus sp. Soil802 TaxID=1736414 RepID=UPI0007027E8A|nr:hypothetical protein [Phycicoccus sp. Soil802]KRF27905.1 hypothetical protein ASG91_10445 [Phycicoccus sp. Soil802]
MSDLDTRLRQALHDLAPEDPTTEGLADGARRYATRARRVRQLGIATAAAATLVLATVLVASFDPPARVVPAGPFLTPADCTRPATITNLPGSDLLDTADAVAAWVCPDPSPRQPASTATTSSVVGTDDGWQLPATEVTGSRLRGLAVSGTNGQACGQIRPGPAFTLALEDESGRVEAYRSTEMTCGGAYALASFLDLLAGEEVDALPASTPSAALDCRTDETWLRTHTSSRTHLLHSPLVAATFCLKPNFVAGDPMRPIQPMTTRSYRSIALPSDTLAALNSDLTSDWGGFFTGNGACSSEGPWTYTVVGVTSAGDERMLATGCLDELWVTGAARTGFIPSAQTTAALEALVPPA